MNTMGIFAGLSVFLALVSPSLGDGPDGGGWMRGRELAWNPATVATNPALRYHALLIGITDYRNPMTGLGWRDLGTAARDAQDLGGILSSNFGFQVSILTDRRATRVGILTELQKASRLNLDDALLIYFAGHGYYDEELGEGFWIPSDARRPEGDDVPREDWIWNSTIEKIIGGSKARHVLIIADSCYAGSMFRGDTERPKNVDLQWYKRANAKPSRYLITSGDFEPVADGRGQHSFFAQSLIDYLDAPDHAIFSASDLGMAVRQRVSARTGQMVRMGPLSLSADAGGEMVFVGLAEWNSRSGP